MVHVGVGTKPWEGNMKKMATSVFGVEPRLGTDEREVQELESLSPSKRLKCI